MWHGSDDQFQKFKQLFNKCGSANNFTVKGDVGNEIEFLDVKMTLTEGDVETTVFIKPTDSRRYLSRRSDHSLHVFKGIPFSQFRRAVVICSSPAKKTEAIEYMSEKFKRSGYSDKELAECKEKALNLNRTDILMKHCSDKKDKTETDDNILTFVINHDPDMVKHLKSFLNQNDATLKHLTGDKKIVISERKSANIASLTFAKSSFSSVEKIFNESQKCGSGRCQTCPVMNLPKNITLNGVPIKLDFSLNCSSECCIYVAVCKFCKFGYYLGQTATMARTRFNGHRGCFKIPNAKYNDSALSMHIYQDHLEEFGAKLGSYDLGIVKCVKPTRLNRIEDYYIYLTKADSLALNRYKAVD